MGIVIKNSIKASVINYIGFGIGAISMLFVQTKFLNESEVGTLRLIVDLAILLWPFVLFGGNNVVTKFHSSFNEKSKNQLFTYVVLIPLLILVILLPILFIFKDSIYNHYNSNSPDFVRFLWLIPFLVLSFVYTSIFESYLAIRSKIQVSSLLRSIFVRIVLLISVLMYAFDYISFYQAVLLYAIGYFIQTITLYIMVQRNFHFNIDLSFSILKHVEFKEIRTFSLFLVLGSGGGILASKIDTIMTEGLIDIASVGIYSVSFFMCTLIDLPRRPISLLLAPMLAKEIKQNNIKQVDILYKKSAINLSIVGTFIFLLIWSNIDLIFSLIPNGENYSVGKWVFFFVGISRVFDLSLGVNNEIIQNSKFYKWNLFLMPFLAVISIFLNLLFIKVYGLIGAAIATAIAIVMYNLIRYSLVKIKLNTQPFTFAHLALLVLTISILLLFEYLNTSFDNLHTLLLLNLSSLSVLYIAPVYLLKLSQDLNNGINKYLKSIKSLK